MALKKYQEEEFIELAYEESIYRARRGMLAFTQFTYEEYEVWCHHVLTCRAINAWLAGKIRFLMVLEPPRHGKSELTSRRLPALIHGQNPKAQIMFGSYSASLAEDMCHDVQNIMDSDEYRTLFPNTRIIEPGSRHPKARRKSNEHTILDANGNLTGGIYRAQGVGGAFSGKGATHGLLDDVIKGRESAESPTFREKLWKWYISDFRSRLAKNAGIMLTMTPWHGDDLAHRLIKQMEKDPNGDQWHILRLPAIKREEDLSGLDKRAIGEALWPNRYPLDELLSIERLDPISFSALYQCKPIAREGGFVNRRSWKSYAERPKDIIRVRQYWDCAEEPGLSNDYSVCATIAETPTGYYWLDVWRDKVAWPELEAAAQDLYHKWNYEVDGLLDKVKIEKKSAGTQLLQSLERKGKIPVEAFNPGQRNKNVRAAAALPTINAGNCYLPETGVPWIEDFKKEHELFPFAENDDQVDTTSMGLEDLRLDADEFDII